MLPEIIKLTSKDLDKFEELICIFEEVFEMKNFNLPDKKHLQQLLAKESFLVFVALVNNKVIGGLTTYNLEQYYSEKSSVYIYDLAVKKEFQRQGVGRSLIASLNSYCEKIGMKEVFVQADLEDSHAIEFYRSTGGIEEKVVHFSYRMNKM